MNGRPGKIILDDWLNHPEKPLKLKDLGVNPPTTLEQEVQRQLRRRSTPLLTTVIDDVIRLKPLAIRRLPIKTLKLAHEVGESHPGDCRCIVCKPPKAQRLRQSYGG